ncbi:MAG: BPTI/Kunitz domain-containing protein [Saprospiraceae bacterium]
MQSKKPKRAAAVLVAAALALGACGKSDCSCQLNDRCKLAPDPGPCEAYIPKYYYDPVEKKCKEFIWGGCGGVVPFDSMQACEEACP